MGLLVEGVWRDQWYDTASSGGAFVRTVTGFRHQIGESPFLPARGRYHLYISLACPWAHRTLIWRHLKGLTDAIGVSIVDPLMLSEGWTLAEGADPINHARRLYEVYLKAAPSMSGRVTVPVLWDTETDTIVNNESAEIIRLFDHAFPGIATGPELCPEALRPEIDALNEWIYSDINNGVYRCGFATTQAAYEEAYRRLFAALDRVEAILSHRRFLLTDDAPCEADWRLFTTLVRFDAVYHGHFKCNRNKIAERPVLWGWLRDLYQRPGIAETVDFGQIKTHYYGSHATINPTGIVPAGPDLDWWGAHGRH